MSIGKGSRIILEDLYLIDLGEKQAAYAIAMKDLAQSNILIHRRFWDAVKKDYPETLGWVMKYEWKTHEILIIRETTPEEESP